MWRRLGWWKWISLFAVLVALMAAASYVTTGILWDGDFLPGEYHVLVVDDSGKPLSGVSLQVINPPGQPDRTSPLREDAPGGMISDSEGQILCYCDGYGFGGFCWKLFWLIPIGNHSAPDFRFVFTKAGYEQRLLTATGFFFDPSDKPYEATTRVTTRNTYGATEEVPVRNRKVVLVRTRQ